MARSPGDFREYLKRAWNVSLTEIRNTQANRGCHMFACIGSRLFAAASLSAFLISTSCVKHVSTLPPGPVTISGVVNDATGLPLSNNPIRLFRERKYLKTSTDASGHYAFPNLAGASYRLLPRMAHRSEERRGGEG